MSNSLRSPRDAHGPAAPLFIALFALTMALLTWRAPCLYMADDAYFYMTIGRNLANGLGSTFGTVTTTNGYHPLWQWLAAGIFLLVGHDDLAALRLAAMFHVLLIAASLWMVWRVALRLTHPTLAAVSPMIFAFVVTRDGWMMETWLYVTLELLLLHWTLRPGVTQRRESAGMYLLRGLFVGLVVLGRLDSAVMVACWFVGIGLRRMSRIGLGPAVRGAMLEGLGAALLVLPYAIGNHHYFGHFATISSMLKTSFPHPTLMGIGDRQYLVLTLPGLFLGLLFLMRPATWFERRNSDNDDERSRLSLGLRILLFGMTLRTLAIYFFANWTPYLVSYWVDPFLALSLMGPAFVASLPGWISGRSSQRPRVIVASFLATVMLAWHAAHVWTGWQAGPALLEAHRALGRWYAATVPADAPVLQRDMEGIPIFWSHRRALDGGGLMNNMEYQRAITAGRLLEYMHEKNVRYAMHDELEILGDAALLAGTYEQARYPLRSVVNPRLHVHVSFPVRREWEVGRYRVVLPPKRPLNRRPVAQTFCAWKFPDDWYQIMKVEDSPPADAPSSPN